MKREYDIPNMEGYRIIDSITLEPGEYIDLLFKPTNLTLYEVSLQLLTLSSDSCSLMGCTNAWEDNMFYWFYYPAHGCFTLVYNSTDRTDVYASLNDLHTFWRRNQGAMGIDDKSAGTYNTSVAPDVSFIIGGVNTVRGVDEVTMRKLVGRCTFTNPNLDLHPAIRLSDDIRGLLDTNTKNFYPVISL